ncbi:sigma-70 family RNA polymerase sigma factor, partial [bacterium]|nr:sigma-70 family RNA polymerase sigma factor [bacterium]
VSLLRSIREGDDRARDALVRRFLPRLTRWARGRLPASARGLVDTDDLVQVSLVKALGHLEDFEPRRDGAFLAYLRRILTNTLRDEIRRAARRPAGVEMPGELGAGSPSPLEEVIGRETLEAYERALEALPERQRTAVVLRLELGMSHQEVADTIGDATSDSARMMVKRALVEIAESMSRGGG